MTITEAQAEAAALGVCLACGGHPHHTPDCHVPHIGWADGTERCARCRRGLDPGDGYLAPTTDQLGAFEVADELLCLPCAFTDATFPTVPRGAEEA